MTTFDSHKAIEQAIYTMNLHGMVVCKIVFFAAIEAQAFTESYMEYLKTADWRWMDNGHVVGFIIDKLTSDWERLLRSIISESERYIVDSWIIA